MRLGILTSKAAEPKSESGFILVVVLWITAALAALASSYSIYVGNASFASQVTDDRLRIRNAITSGIELTAYELLAEPDNLRPPRGAFSVRLARSTIDVAFVSESARIDLNAAPKGVLGGLFAAVGVNPSEATTFADRIIGWRKKADRTGRDNEVGAYREAGLDYAPRQAPFQNVLELRLVLGLPPYIVERILPLVTIYSGRPEVDVRVAPPEVLASLPNVTPDRLQKILAARTQDSLNGEALLSLLGGSRGLANAATNPAARIELQIRLDDGRSARAEVVILVVRNDDAPYRVLSWRDDSD